MFFFYLDLIRFNMLLIFHFREFLCNFIREQIKTSFIHSCHGVYLVLDSYQKVFNLLVFLFSSFFNLSVFALKPLLIYFFILFSCSIVWTFPCIWKTWFQLTKCLLASIALGFLYHIWGWLILCETRFSTFHGILYSAEKTFF